MSDAGSSRIIRAAGAMGAATFISRLLGLVREQVFAYMFGAGNATDAFNIAFRIPNLLRDLFAEGAMSASLVPTFTRVRVEEGDVRAWRVAGLVFRVLFGLVAILAVLGVLFAPQLVGLYASAFKEIPGKFELTVRMTRIMFPYFPLVALAAAFMGILNACGYFFMPALSPALFNTGSILMGVTLAVTFGRMPSLGMHPIEGMAMGVVIGGGLQAIFQLPTLYRAGYRWPGRMTFPTWNRDPALRTMIWMMVPGTIGLAATQVNILVNAILSTSQGPGAVSWLNYSFRLMQFPIGIFGVSLASAALPRVSRQWVENDAEGVRTTLHETLKSVFAVNLPASAGLAFLGLPIIQMIFQHGHFRQSDSEATAMALAMYSLGLTAYSAVKVLVPACYALGNTRLPVISSVLSVVFTIILNLIMIGPFGYWGLALGTSCAAFLNFAFLVGAIGYLIREKGGRFPAAPLIGCFAKHLAIALAMGFVCKYSYALIDQWAPGHLRIPKVGLVIAEGAACVALIARIFGVSETSQMVELFLGKLKKKLRRAPT